MMFSPVFYLRLGLAISLALSLGSCFDKKYIERLASCPSNGFTQLVVAPDGKTFITGGERVIQWDTVSGQKLREFDFNLSNSDDFQPFPPRIFVLAVASDGKTLVGSTFITTFKNRFIPKPISKHFILTWDIATGNKTQVWNENFEEPNDFIRFLAIDPDSKILISQTYYGGVIKLRTLSNGQLINRIDGKGTQRFPVVISPDRDFFASMHDDGTVKFWEIVSGKQLGSLKAHPSHTPLAISINDKTLLIQNAGDVKRFRDIITGAELRTLYGSYIENPFATTINGEYVLIQSGQAVNLHDMIAGSKIRAFEEIPPNISELFVSPDGKTFLSVDSLGNYILWDLKTGKKLFTLIEGWMRGENVFTSDSKTLINVSGEANYVTIWNLSTGNLTHQFCINKE